MGKLTEEQRQERSRARNRREALQAEDDDRRREATREQWQREGTYLSRVEFKAAIPAAAAASRFSMASAAGHHCCV